MAVIRLGRRDVERRIVNGDPLRRDLPAQRMGDLPRIALFDRNSRPRRQRPIERTGRRRDVKRNAVRPGQRRHAVGADLVGRVAIGRDPIGPDDDRLHAAGLHHVGRHRVANQRGLDAALLQLPSGQPSSLPERPRFVDIDVQPLPLLVGGKDQGQAPCRNRPSPVRRHCSASAPPRRRPTAARPAGRSGGSPGRSSRCIAVASASKACAQPTRLVGRRHGRRRAAHVSARCRSIRAKAQNRLTAVGRLVAR